MKKVRNSNMELLRVIAMLFVLIVHCGYAVYGFPRLNKVVSDTPLWIMRMTIQHATICCVNIFVLLSGWFGIRPTLKGGLYLLFQIFFIGLVMLLGVKFFTGVFPKNFELIFNSFTSFWFVWSYFFIYLISPLLNKFIEHSTLYTQIGVILSLLSFQVIDGLLDGFSNIFNWGYSPTSFMMLYLIARCINYRTLPLSCKPISVYLTIYLLCILFPVVLLVSLAFLGFKDFFNILTGYLIAYNNPIVILESVALLLLFNKMDFKSNLVNWLGAGSFAAYLTHQNVQVRSYFKSFVLDIYSSFNSFSAILIIFLFVLFVFLVSVVIDKLRLFLWNKYIENIAYKIDAMTTQKIGILLNK